MDGITKAQRATEENRWINGEEMERSQRDRWRRRGGEEGGGEVRKEPNRGQV